MALKIINLGSVANDGTGDDLREAFDKVVFNFAELDARTPEATTVVNLGTGEGLYANTNDAELQFKSIIGGNNVTLSSDSDELTINVDAGVTQFIVAADSGSLTVTENTTVTIQGGTLISTTRDGNNIRIDSSALSRVQDDATPRLGGSLDANGNNIGNIGIVTATDVQAGNMSVSGSLTGLVHGIDIRDLNYNRDPDNWNFGGITPTTVTNLWDFMWATVNVDFGGITPGTETNVTLDLGPINI
jgi:hypothetical protein